MKTALFILTAVLAGQSAAPTISWKEMRAERKGWFSIKASYPTFHGDALASFASKEWRAALDADLARLNVRENLGDEMPPIAWELTYGSKVGLASAELISGYSEFFFYTGGAHPNREYKGLTFGMVDGKPVRVKLGHLMTVRMAPEALASELVLPKLRAMGASSVVEGTITTLTKEQADNFVVTPAGITWLFSPYEVASYAEGHFFVKVPWSEMEGKVRRTP